MVVTIGSNGCPTLPYTAIGGQSNHYFLGPLLAEYTAKSGGRGGDDDETREGGRAKGRGGGGWKGGAYTHINCSTLTSLGGGMAAERCDQIERHRWPVEPLLC